MFSITICVTLSFKWPSAYNYIAHSYFPLKFVMVWSNGYSFGLQIIVWGSTNFWNTALKALEPPWTSRSLFKIWCDGRIQNVTPPFLVLLDRIQ